MIDVGIDKLTISGIIHRIIEVDAQIVGISSFIANHGNGLKIAHEIKKQFGSQVKVMMGGPQASFVYEEVLKQGDVDIVSIFEGEQTIVELLNCIKTGGDLKKIAGIAFVNEEGEVIKTERRLPIQDLDTIPFCNKREEGGGTGLSKNFESVSGKGEKNRRSGRKRGKSFDFGKYFRRNGNSRKDTGKEKAFYSTAKTVFRRYAAFCNGNSRKSFF